MSRLYIVPTPIGNLKDITFRAIDVLNDVHLILAEDTRNSSHLLQHYNIDKPLKAYHAFNEHQTLHSLIQRILSGEKTALISDAGTPSISDPGFLIVRECLRENIPVECLPGATAFVPALISSGLPNERFVFEGFLPQKKGRQSRINNLVNETRTMVFYESPYRLIKTLEHLAGVFGPGRKACVARELTKLHEEIRRGSLAELIQHFSAKQVKGEIVLIVGGNPKK
jgi:16S rRNA (cytidine1402-2'-O)-methyltransferase